MTRTCLFDFDRLERIVDAVTGIPEEDRTMLRAAVENLRRRMEYGRAYSRADPERRARYVRVWRERHPRREE